MWPFIGLRRAMRFWLEWRKETGIEAWMLRWRGFRRVLFGCDHSGHCDKCGKNLAHGSRHAPRGRGNEPRKADGSLGNL
jgi:hypothetical protein